MPTPIMPAIRICRSVQAHAMTSAGSAIPALDHSHSYAAHAYARTFWTLDHKVDDLGEGITLNAFTIEVPTNATAAEYLALLDDLKADSDVVWFCPVEEPDDPFRC